EEILDVVGAVPEAQDELGVPEVRVIAHHMPDQRTRTDQLHRLGHAVTVGRAHAHAVPAAEQHDLHRAPTCIGSTTRTVGNGNTSRPPHCPMWASWAVSSASRFHGNTTTTSGRSASMRSGAWIGILVPGVNFPCLYGLRSTVYSSRSGRIP